MTRAQLVLVKNRQETTSNMRSGGVSIEESLADVQFENRPKKSLRFKILLIAVILLVVLAITFIVLYAVEKTSTRVLNTDAGGPTCTTRQCVVTAMGKSYFSFTFDVYVRHDQVLR